jgi:hypothetical protein
MANASFFTILIQINKKAKYCLVVFAKYYKRKSANDTMKKNLIQHFYK